MIRQLHQGKRSEDEAPPPQFHQETWRNAGIAMIHWSFQAKGTGAKAMTTHLHQAWRNPDAAMICHLHQGKKIEDKKNHPLICINDPSVASSKGDWQRTVTPSIASSMEKRRHGNDPSTASNTGRFTHQRNYHGAALYLCNQLFSSMFFLR
jgi:hypothetical protein